IFHIDLHSSIPAEEEQYSLNTDVVLRAALGYAGFPSLRLAMEADTKRQARIGAEYRMTSTLACEGGVYLDGSSPGSVEAMSLGVGAAFSNMRFDLAYLAFFSQLNRQGKA